MDKKWSLWHCAQGATLQHEWSAFCTVFRDNFASPVLPLDTDSTLETLPRERRALEGVREREKEWIDGRGTQKTADLVCKKHTSIHKAHFWITSTRVHLISDRVGCFIMNNHTHYVPHLTPIWASILQKLIITPKYFMDKLAQESLYAWLSHVQQISLFSLLWA